MIAEGKHIELLGAFIHERNPYGFLYNSRISHLAKALNQAEAGTPTSRNTGQRYVAEL